MSSGGEIWAVHAGNNAIKTPVREGPTKFSAILASRTWHVPEPSPNITEYTIIAACPETVVNMASTTTPK